MGGSARARVRNVPTQSHIQCIRVAANLHDTGHDCLVALELMYLLPPRVWVWVGLGLGDAVLNCFPSGGRVRGTRRPRRVRTRARACQRTPVRVRADARADTRAYKSVLHPDALETMKVPWRIGLGSGLGLRLGL